MGRQRNGARLFLDVIAKACRLSHLPGFRTGVSTILGAESAEGLFVVFDPFCAYVDTLISLDDWFNKRDATLPDADGSEDGPLG